MRRIIPSNLAQLLRIHDFVLLWSGSTVSLLGDGIYFVAIAWEVYRLSNVPTALGLVGVAFSLPQILFLLVGGIASDRLDRRVVLIAGNLVSGLAIGTLGVLVQLQVVALWQIVGLVVFYGTSQAFFLPASRAVIPSLVPAKLLPHASAVQQFAEPITTSMLGPALGGVMIAAWGTGPAFLADAASFVIAAVALSLIVMPAELPVEAGLVAPASRKSILSDVGDAFAFVRSRPWLWATLVAAGIANVALTGPQMVLIPYVIKFLLHAPPSGLGQVFASGGLGSVAAAILVGWRGLPRRNVTWMMIAWAGATLALAPVALATSVWQVMALSFVTGGGVAYGNMVWFTFMASLVPRDMIGRVSSLDYLVSFSLTPLSSAATGPIAGVVGIPAVLIGAGLGAGLITLAFVLVPGIREPERLMRELSHR